MKKETFTTYCFNDFEDIILSTAFKNLNNGFYIDIGANDPISQSVTKYFYDNRNWSGINIEPLKKEYSLLCKERPRDINLNIGVSDKEEEKTLYIDKELSTFDQNVINKDIASLNKEYIKLYSLTYILDKYLKKNSNIHFCKIDVEGFEQKVLKGIDFNKYRPFLFCIESTLPCTDIPSYQHWEDILIRNNYSLVFTYNVNRYYADTTCKMYNTIKNNLNTENNSCINLEKKENKTTKILKSLWHLLPVWFREKIYYGYKKKASATRRAKKLVRALNLKYKIKVII